MIEVDEFIRLKKLIEELIDRSEDGAVIVVEGIKDVIALRNLGVRGEILTTSGMSDAALVDVVGRRDVIIFTDCDRRGKFIERNLVSKFSSWGVTPDTELKRKIFALVRKDITTVESLAGYYIKVKRELGFSAKD
jgi:5S rRNA maturation endonuclease (ribonuclease M5)